ncbi:HAD-IA family hydrolase [Gymnodinialimonas sp. 2305UL16-5]|uniref:HAD family hydrolase n=1 Tax=Gymnodinialimonas mytili TaxID=3126503 RepID=UPI0030B514D5
MTQAPKALFFGSIGTLTETSEMQRISFNAAFRDAGLDWEWGRADYAEMLKQSGGAARIARYAKARGESVDAEAIHALKVAHFAARAEQGLELRPGVAEVIRAAQNRGIDLAFVTSTGRQTVDLILGGLGDVLTRGDFRFVGDRSMVEESKPAPDIYQRALVDMGLAAKDVLAIEDTPDSAKSALAAGISCVAFPGHMFSATDFPAEMRVCDHLSPAMLGLVAAAE